MNSTTFADSEVFGLNVPTFLPTDTSSTLGFIASTLFIAFALTVIYDNVLYPRISATGRFWSEQAWMINPGESFSRLRARLRSVKQSKDMLSEGYKNFSKKGKAFVMPIMGNGPLLVLPPTELRELLGKPDKELDEHIPHNEATQTKYTIRNSLMSANNFHFDVVRRELTRKLPLLTPDVYDELCHGLNQFWNPSSTEWNTVKVYPTTMRIVSRAANRVFGGTELCRNDEFLEHSKLYSQGIFGGAAMINLVPKVLRPLLAPIITYPNRKNFNICQKHAEPVIRERLDNTLRKLNDSSFEWEAPTDALQWLIEMILERGGDPAELQPSQICSRLLGLNMVAIHTTSMVMANVILDLYSAPRAREMIAGLREECDRVLAAHGGVWTKQAVNELLRVDSTVRETMRWTGLGNVSLHRLVVADSGVDFQGGDIHVPKGVRVVIPAWNMHHDEDFYPNADQYDPFRFSRPREEHQAATSGGNNNNDNGKDMQKELDLKNQGLITISDRFLAFGNGRHACPGRFFAAQEMKLMLAEIITSYDVEIVGEGRPANVHLVSASMPSSTAEIRVKRRS